MYTLQDRLDTIKQQIEAAKARSIYKQEVKLVAVTKTFPEDVLQQAYNCGLKIFGENRVQELLAKKPQLPPDIEWHLIGALQTNKVKSILPNVKLIHSLDRVSLAEEINKQSAKNSVITEALLEINVAKEETKHGLLPEEVSDFVHYLQSKEHIKVVGLMTVAPYTENPEEIRWVFRALRQLFLDFTQENLPNISMRWLSMGMTNDFEIAIEEGSNLVRIGSGIFGER